MKKRRISTERTCIFGFGIQGSAQAMNLFESGWPVTVCLRPKSPRIVRAREADLPVQTDPLRAARETSIAVLLLPDAEQPSLYRDFLGPELPPGSLMIFAHGFSIHYRLILPRADIDVALVAPLAHGETLRSEYHEGRGTPCLIAIAQDASGKATARALAYAKGIARDGPFITTTFAEEVETDLFSEQAVLCGGVPELVRAAFETLVSAGYQREIAYACCLRELRAIASVMELHGIAGMRERISDTARFGALTRGPRIIGEEARKTLRRILEEIRSGAFAQELAEEQRAGSSRVREGNEADRLHDIEAVHRSFSANKSV